MAFGKTFSFLLKCGVFLTLRRNTVANSKSSSETCQLIASARICAAASSSNFVFQCISFFLTNENEGRVRFKISKRSKTNSSASPRCKIGWRAVILWSAVLRDSLVNGLNDVAFFKSVDMAALGLSIRPLSESCANKTSNKAGETPHKDNDAPQQTFPGFCR